MTVITFFIFGAFFTVIGIILSTTSLVKSYQEQSKKNEEIVNKNEELIHKSEEIALLNKKLLEISTSGDNACMLTVSSLNLDENKGRFRVSYLRNSETVSEDSSGFLSSTYPLHNVHIEVKDLDGFNETEYFRRDVLYPTNYQAHEFSLGSGHTRKFFVSIYARNGVWRQYLQLNKINDVWLRAIKVFSEDTTTGEWSVFYEEYDSGFPLLLDSLWSPIFERIKNNFQHEPAWVHSNSPSKVSKPFTHGDPEFLNTKLDYFLLECKRQVKKDSEVLNSIESNFELPKNLNLIVRLKFRIVNFEDDSIPNALMVLMSSSGYSYQQVIGHTPDGLLITLPTTLYLAQKLCTTYFVLYVEGYEGIKCETINWSGPSEFVLKSYKSGSSDIVVIVEPQLLIGEDDEVRFVSKEELEELNALVNGFD